MIDPRLIPIQETVKKAKIIHADLIKQFTEGGIFSPTKAPLLKKGIEKFENFFMDIEKSKSIAEMEEVVKKHFTSTQSTN